MNNNPNDIAAAVAASQLQQLLAVGAEPYWMQDIRLAQRRLEAQRQLLQAARGEAHSEAPARPPSPDQAAS